MAILKSQLILSIIDKATAPARGIQGRINALTAASQANAAKMAEVRGRMVDAVAAGYMLYRGLSAPITAAANFEEAMNKVGVVSRANDEDLHRLNQTARELGRTTMFTASEVADGMGYLAMAGFNAEQVMASMADTLNLAAAGNMDLGRSADIVSNILTGYALDVEDLTKVSDILVGTFTRTNTDLSQLGEAFKYAGPLASAAGMDFAETAAVLGRLGDAGYQASLGGTALRGAIIRLLAPTGNAAALMSELEVSIEDVAGEGVDLEDALGDAAAAMQKIGLTVHDANGKMLPFVDIMRQLESHADDAGLMAQLFGVRAGPAMTALLRQGSAGVADLAAELDALEGESLRVADARMQGFNGRMRAFNSAIEGMNIAIGNALLPSLTSMVNALTTALGPITELAEKYPRVTSAVIGTASAIVAFRIAALAGQYAGLFFKGALIDVALASLRATQAMGRLVGAIVLQPAIAAFNALRTAVIGYTAAASIAGHGAALKMLGGSLLGLLNPLHLVRGAFVALRVALLSTGIGAILVGIAAAGTWIWNNWSGIARMFTEFGSAFLEAIQPVMPALQPVIDGVSSLVGWVSDLLGPIDEAGEGWAAMGRNAGDALGGMVLAVAEVVTAVAEIPGKVAALAAEMFEAGKALGKAIFDGVMALISELAEYIRNALTGALNSVASSARSLASTLSFGYFGGGDEVEARAEGGPVRRGQPYIVGEEGWELFVPDVAGTIVPHHKATRAAAAPIPSMHEVYADARGDVTNNTTKSAPVVNISNNPTFNFTTASDPREIARHVQRAMGEANRAAIEMAFQD